MKPRHFLICLPAACLLFATGFAEDAPAPTAKPPAKQASKEEIEARLAEHARKKAMGSAVAAASGHDQKGSAKTDGKTPESPAQATDAKAADSGVTKTPPPEAEAPATVLPKLEVQKGKITELDRQLAQQNKEIAREKENTKPTKLDETLNGPKISKALAVFGGQSSDDRANIAKERVSMMQDEKDLMEAIAQTQDKTEKEELQKTLASIKAMRRELENSLR